jgi:acyl carrier protein
MLRMSGDLPQRVAGAVRAYIAARYAALGKPAGGLEESTDLFAEGVLDSVALTALIAAVESATGREIDFIDVDPDALGTIDGIVTELSRAVET